MRNLRRRDWRFTGFALMTTSLAFVCWYGCDGTGRRGAAAPRTTGPIRAIWVTRWDYKNPADIAAVMDNCRSAGFNTILFQVRGAGTAFYRSRIEPWADELGGRDPGFDPLAVACREGHRRGLAVHAWVNVIPGFRGKKPPKSRRQLYNAHPDWFWHDARGRREPLGWYNNLNPCLPEVRRYLVAVMREIAKYPIDGIHMDYIRFPNEWNDAYPTGARVPDYPRDRRTLALFKRATGKTPDGAPKLWNRWRTDQITRLVRDIRRGVRKVNQHAVLTAAVGAFPEDAKRKHFQDARRWVAEGLVDALYPMNYAANMRTYQNGLAQWTAERRRVPIVIGVYVDKRGPSLVAEQIDRAVRSHGHFAGFAYNSLFERRDRPTGLPASGRLIMDDQSPSRAALRQRLIPHLRSLASRAVAKR